MYYMFPMAYVCFSNNPVRWTLNCIDSVEGRKKYKIEISLFLNHRWQWFFCKMNFTNIVSAKLKAFKKTVLDNL